MSLYKSYDTLIVEHNEQYAVVSLNRIDIHNAYNDILINELYDVFNFLKEDRRIRVVVLTGCGETFCSGADLNWLKNMINTTYRQNLEESLTLAQLMFFLFTFPKPIIAKINGSAFGSGIGLMAVCDIIIADNDAKFGFTEVSLGLVPAIVSPYIINRIGESMARALFITGDIIDAERAYQIGLVNFIVPNYKLDDFVEEKINTIIKNAPDAVRIAKEMTFKVAHAKFPEIQGYITELFSNIKISTEGQEGMKAFIEKRKPKWIIE